MLNIVRTEGPRELAARENFARGSRALARGFTLIELLVVIAVSRAEENRTNLRLDPNDGRLRYGVQVLNENR